MARKRTVKKSNGSSSRATKHGGDARSSSIDDTVASTVRVILLIIIGLGIVAFLFYPDISRVVGMMTDNEGQSVNKRDEALKARTPNPNVKVKENKERSLRNDPMEDEDEEVEVSDEDDIEVEMDTRTFARGDNGPKSNVPEDTIKPIPEFSIDREPVHNRNDGASQSRVKSSSKVDETETASKHAKEKADNMLKFSSDDKEITHVELKVEDRTKEKPQEQSRVEEEAEARSESEHPNKDLPEEVRKFEASYLKTVTAKKIFADGRRIPPIELLAQKPTNSSVKVFLFDEFLSTEECDGLMKAHDRHVKEATKQDPILCFDSIGTLRQHLKEAKKKLSVNPNVFTKGTKCVNATFSRQLSTWLKGNWSYSTAFYPGESKFSTIFANRVKAAMGLAQENGGKFQITSYPKGKAYKSHTDCVEGGDDKRDRVATVLVYLQDVQDGGETKFPELGIWVKPRKGRALVWNNMSPSGQCEPHSIHTASKVEKGNKYVLIRWYYYKNFYSLGKRPPEPHLPERQPGQPRVSCDEFEYGSCRWYDEWNYEHMLEYERQKLTLI